MEHYSGFKTNEMFNIQCSEDTLSGYYLLPVFHTFYGPLWFMEQYIHYNGAIVPVNQRLVTADNRGLRYGDGLFETIKVLPGSLTLAPFHFDRLFHGLSVLQIKMPDYFSPAWFTEQVLALCRKNHLKQAARARLNIFRGNGHLNLLTEPYPHVVIQVEPLPSDYLQFYNKELVAGIYPDARKSCDELANLKSNNFLPYVMAALYARQQGLDECLLLNMHNRICDATIANIFWINGGMIFTPPLTEGCVAGVMRRFLLEKIPEAGIALHEKELTEEELLKADEVFLTNALYGIRPVSRIKDSIYSNTIATRLYHRLIKNPARSELF